MKYDWNKEKYLAIKDEDLPEKPSKEMHHISSAPAFPLPIYVWKKQSKELMYSYAIEQLEDLRELLLDCELKTAVKIRNQGWKHITNMVIAEIVYDSEFGFEPIPKEIYHVYINNEKRIISLVGPNEGSLYDEYLGSVQARADKSFKIVHSTNNLDDLIKTGVPRIPPEYKHILKPFIE